MENEESCFLVTYRDSKDNKIITIKAKKICDSLLGLSFVAISDFVFKTKGKLIDDNEDQMQKRFEHTKTLHLSLYAIISIEEVGPNHPGLQFENDKSKLLVLHSQNAPANS